MNNKSFPAPSLEGIDVNEYLASEATKGKANQTPEAYEFPMQVFSTNLRNIIEVICENNTFCLDYAGLTVLTAASALIGNSYYAKLKENYTVSCALYSALPAEIGHGKSPIFKTFLKPLYAFEDTFENLQNENQKRYETELSNYLANKETATKPKEPQRKDLILSDSTIEAVYHVLKRNPNGVLLTQDEILAWINGMNQYRKGADEQVWLSVIDNMPIKINRAGGKTLYIKKPFVSVLGGIQPDLLQELAKNNRDQSGFLFRILFAYPAKPPKTLYFKDVETDKSIFENYAKIMTSLHPAVINDYETEAEAEHEPNYLLLSKEAKKAYSVFSKANADYLDLGTNSFERAITIKLSSFVIRFALIIELLNWADSNLDQEIKEPAPAYITLESLQKGMLLFDYFKQTAMRVGALIGNKINHTRPQNENLADLELAFYSSLPNVEYGRKEFIVTANELGILNEKTAYNYHNQLIDIGFVQKTGHGRYVKKTITD